MKYKTDDKVKKENIFRGHDILPKILCVIAAFILWLYVTQVETSEYEETFNGVSIELINTSVLETEAGLYVYSGYGNTVNVTVSGKKSSINRYTSENIRVYADVSDIKDTGRQTVPIVAEAPSGLSVKALSISSISVYVDEKSTIEVDVKPKISSAVIGSGCELGELLPEYTLVSVTGPKTILKNVDYAQISLNLGNVTASMTTIGEIELVSKTGEAIDMRYVQLNRSEIKVTVPVYTTKEVPLTVDYKYGYYNDSNVKITISPETIHIKGDPSELDKIDSITVGTLDEKKITSDSMQVYILNLPDGITAAEEVDNVNVSVAHIGTTVSSFSVSNIKVTGASGKKYSVETTALTVRLRGDKDSLDKIEESDISVTVNLSEFSSSVSGTVTVNADISVSGAASSVYPLGEYPVQIKIG